MSIVRKYYKQGTKEPRKFVIPKELFDGNMFDQLPNFVPQLQRTREHWPVEYEQLGNTVSGTATVFRFGHDAEDSKIQGFIDELIRTNQSRFTHYTQLGRGEFEYQPPYDKDAW